MDGTCSNEKRCHQWTGKKLGEDILKIGDANEIVPNHKKNEMVKK